MSSISYLSKNTNMGKYIHRYNNAVDFEDDYWSPNYIEPNLSVYGDGSDVHYDRPGSHELLKEPLTFEIIQAGDGDYLTFFLDGNVDQFEKEIQYSKNGGEKINVSAYKGHDVTIPIVGGDVIRFWGDNDTYCDEVTSSLDAMFVFGCDGQCRVKGNIMSLIDSVNYENLKTFTEKKVFANLFYYCEGLFDAYNLILPATACTESCYANMFNSCVQLESAPFLPATKLANWCYQGMFFHCHSLHNVPEILPAKNLATGCYTDMFNSCNSLSVAPVLPAITLQDSCYQAMFYNCTNLKKAPKISAMNLANYCCTSMFQGCTRLVEVPELPAVILVDYCYSSMFYGCTNLKYIKCMATHNINPDKSVNHWVNGVGQNGKFIKTRSSTWSRGENGIPTGWSTEYA